MYKRLASEKLASTEQRQILHLQRRASPRSQVRDDRPSMSPQNSQMIWRQAPHGGVGDGCRPTTAMRVKARLPSDSALKIATRSAQIVRP